MTIPVTKLHILRLMLQMEQNLSGLQRDMRNNAFTWKAMAQAQSPTAAIIATYMNDAAVQYQRRLGWLTTLQADSDKWGQLGSMWTRLGGTSADFSGMTTPLTAVADQLGPATKNNYTQIINICNQIIAEVDAPLSLWPE